MAPRKTKKLWVRLTWDQWMRLRRAARLQSALRQEGVAPGTLLREVGFPQIERLLADLETPTLTSENPRRSGEEHRVPVVVP
jgi:methylphosphotriester-DNA--protein-cysteine methyltransferase